MKSFRIDVYRAKDAYSACAFGVQGNWSRGLNSALEDLLNKLLQAGIDRLEIMDQQSALEKLDADLKRRREIMQNEPAEKTPFDVERSDAPGELTAREDAPETSP